MWKDLTTEQKAEIFKNAVSAGLTNLEDIKKLYNKQAKESRPDLEDPYPMGMGDNFYDDGGIIYSPYDLPIVDYTDTYKFDIKDKPREREDYFPMTDSNTILSLVFPDTYAYGGNLFKKGGKKVKTPYWKLERTQDAWWNNGQRIYNMMINEWGLTVPEAIGILANMGIESGVDHTAVSGRDKHGVIYKGLVQNEPGIVKYIINNYGDYSEASQLQFLRDGLEGKMRGADKKGLGKLLQKRLLDYRKYVATLDPNDPNIYRRTAGAFNAHYENPQVGVTKGRYEVGEPRMYTGEQMGIRLNRMNSSNTPIVATNVQPTSTPTTPKVKVIARPPAKPDAYSGATPPNGPIQFTQEELDAIYGEEQPIVEPVKSTEPVKKSNYTPKYKAKRNKEWEYTGPNISYIDPDLSPWAAMIIAGVPLNQKTNSWGIRPNNAKYGVSNSHHKKAWKGGIDTNKTWYAYRKEVEESASKEDRKAIKDYFDSIEDLIIGRTYGSALDITPAPGYTYDDLLKSFANPILQEWAAANDFGLLDERSAEVRARTGGTGPHLHYGPDSKIPRFKDNALMAYYTPYWEDRAAAMQPVTLPQENDNFIDITSNDENINTLFTTTENPDEVRTGTEERGGFNTGEGSYFDPIALSEITVQPPKILPSEEDDARILLDDYYFGSSDNSVIPQRRSIIPNVIMPNYTSRIPQYPMLEVNMATPYTDIIMGRKASKGGKLFDIGGYTQGQLYGGERKYQLVPTTEASQDVFQGYAINPGDLVWADEQGNIIKGNNNQAIADLAALKGRPLMAQEPLPTVTVTGQANQTKPMPLTELFTVPTEPPKISFDRNAFKEQWLQNDLERQRQEKAHADERARALTPGAGTFVVAPTLATLAGIGAAEAAPVLPWLVNNPVGRQLTYSILGGELVNEGTKLFGDLTGNPNNGFGDYMARTTGVGNDFWWGFANPGYALNPTRAAVGTAARVAEDALNNTQVFDPLVEGIKTGINDYSRGMFNVDLGQAYRTAQMSRALANTYAENARLGLSNSWNRFAEEAQQSHIIDPRLAKLQDKAEEAIRGIKNRAQDKAYTIRNVFKRDEQPILPSKRKEFEKLKQEEKTLRGDLQVPRIIERDINEDDLVVTSTLPGKSPIFLNTSKPIRYREETTYDPIAGTIRADVKYTATEDIIEAFKKMGIPEERLPKVGEEGSAKVTTWNSMLNILKDETLTNQGNKQLVDKVNAELQGLGHVTGSQITALEPYATHRPADVDIITTEDNLAEVVKILTKGKGKPIYGKDHFKVQSDNYGEVDVQVIRNGDKKGTSQGLIAFETQRKAAPETHAEAYSENKLFAPIKYTPNELLKMHEDKVGKMSTMDQILSKNNKHVERGPMVLRSNNDSYIQREIDNTLELYEGIFGDKFMTLKDQGIDIDYTDVASNYAFLKKLNVDDDVAKMLSENPLKMKYILDNIAYERTTSVRAIQSNGLNKKEIEAAINSNSSYANHAGNQARRRFGGSESVQVYGGDEGIVTATQFKLRNGSNIHNAMDLYKELYRYATSPPGEFEAFLQKQDFKLTPEQSKYWEQKLRMINPPQTLNDLIPYTDQDNVDRWLGMTRDEAIALNNELAQYFDIDYINSNQPGFDNQFIGVLNSHVPNKVEVRQKTKGDEADSNFYGFELPRLKFDSQKADETRLEINGNTLSSYLISKDMNAERNKIWNELLKLGQKHGDTENKISNIITDTADKIDVEKEALKTTGKVTGGILGATGLSTLLAYALSEAGNMSTSRAANILDRNFDKNIEEVKRDWGFSDEQVEELKRIQKTQGYEGVLNYLDYWR